MAKHTESCKHILFTMSYWRQCWSLVMQLFSFAIPLLVSDVDVVHIVLDPETMPPWQPFISGWCATALTTLLGSKGCMLKLLFLIFSFVHSSGLASPKSESLLRFSASTG